MASALANSLLLVALGLCAFSLQGCGREEVEDNSAAYATAAAGAGDGAAAKDMQTNGGCPAFLSGIDLAKDDFLAEVVPAITGSLACNSSHPTLGTNFTSAKCKKVIVQKLSDAALYFAEKDPGFTAWTKNVSSWTKEAKGEVESELLKAFGEPTAALQSFVATKISEGLEMGSEELTEYLTTQVWQETQASLGVFCPAPVEAVAAAEAADAGSVAAQKTSEENEKIQQTVNAKNEAAAEGIDANGESTTTIAGVPSAPTSTEVPSTSAVSATTAFPISTSASTTVEKTDRRLADLLV